MSPAESTLDTKIGPLAETSKLFKKGTLRESAELMNERITKKTLRNIWFYTANIGAYEHNEDGTLTYYITDKVGFNKIAASNIGEFCKQLLDKQKQNYHLNKGQRNELHTLAEQGHAVKVNSKDLNLQGDDKEWRYFEIDTSNYDSTLNESQRAFAEMVYGKGKDFIENMKMLAEAGKTTTRIYVLNPEYVKKSTKKGSAIARACRLGNFGNDSSFGASLRLVDGSNALRGVLKDTAGAAEKINQQKERDIIEAIRPYILTKDLSEVKGKIRRLYRR